MQVGYVEEDDQQGEEGTGQAEEDDQPELVGVRQGGDPQLGHRDCGGGEEAGEARQGCYLGENRFC